MADIASLVVKVSTDGANKAQSELDKLAKQSSKTESATGSLSKSFGLLNIALSTVAIGSLIKETAQLADIYKLTEGRLSLVTKNTIELATAQQEILKISQKTRQSYADTIDLYTRVARSTQDLGKSQSDILKFTEIVNKSLVISGASAENSKAAIMQLGQALASGVLQGDELRSILENAPRLSEAIAKGMGKTVGELRILGEQGKLTAEEVFNAIQKQGDAIDKEFGKMPKTIGQATTQMGNSILELVGTMDKLTGASGFVADKISSLSKTMDDFSSNARVASSSVFEQKTVDDITIKANQIASEIQSLQTKLKENDGALWFGLDDRTQSEYINKIKRLEQQMEQLGQTAVDVLWKTSQGTKSAVLSGEQVKKQLDQSLGGFKAYYKAIGDEEVVLAIRRHELIEKYKDLTAQQIEAIINSERDKNNKTEELAKEWAKRKIEIATNISIAEQDKLAEPFIKLEAKYKEDLEHFKGNKEAQIMLTNEYNAEVSRLQKDLTEKFNEEEKKKAEKAIEWQVKLFEANEKINDQIIAQREKMYGASSEAQIEAWYNNQLEWLGKLALEGKATSEELQGLLNKIDSLKELKLKEQTISFKIEKSFYDSFESSLTDSIEDAFNGDSLNLKKFFKNIQKSLTNTITSSMSGSIVNSLRGGTSLLGGLSSLAVGSSVSASEISTIMNSGGTFDSATNTITTSGGSKINVGADGGGVISKGGSDLSSLVNTVSSLKTAYGVLSNGLSSSVLGMFQSGASGLSSLGFAGAGSALGEFGVGFASPWGTQAASAAASQAGATAGLYGSGVGQVSGAQMAGGYASGALMGAGVGYGVGTLGDKLFGAQTKAGSLGAVGGAIGSVFGPIGMIAGAAIGSAIGGIFGKKKTTDTGVQFFDNISSLDTITSDMVKTYSDWEKKSWFSKKRGTNYGDLSSSQMKQIESVFDTYDYLLTQLGDNDKIWLDAGKYTGQTFQDAITKNFIKAFTDIDQNTDATIYNAWVDYATSIDKTVIEALTTSIGTFVQSKRTFELWSLGDSIEALAKRAEFATADLDLMKNSMGATGVTVESFLNDFNNAVKTNFTPETITQWESLGNALMSATDAQEAYTTALANFVKSSNEYLVNFNIWSKNSSGATIDGLKIKADYLQSSFESLEKSMGLSGVTVDNFIRTYESLMNDDLGVINQDMVTQLQALGNALMGATDAQKAYEAALNQQTVATKQANEAIRQATLNILGQQLTEWISALDSIQGALDDLNPTFLTFSEIANQSINLDNYSTLLSQLESSRQNEIEKLTQSSNLRIEQLEKEKTLFTSISDFVDELTQKIIGYSVTTSSYFFSELANAKSLISSGGTPDISSLKSSASSYLDKALGESTSKIEYLREVAKVREGIGGLGSLVTGGSLEGIENAINEEQKALENQLTQLNETATNILNSWKSQAGLNISATASNIKGVQNDVISSAYKEILGRTPDTAGYQYWSNDITSGAVNSSDITKAISIAAIDEIYNNVLGRNADEAGKAYWISEIESGKIAPSDIDEAIKNAAIVNGSHAGGLERVPFDGYIAELHKGERVQTASEVKNDSMITDLTNSIKDLKDMFIKNIAETSRMSRVITRLDDNDALLVRVVV